jgi:hypothetical protein
VVENDNFRTWILLGAPPVCDSSHHIAQRPPIGR